MTNIVIVVGDLGGGKTTLAAWFTQFTKYYWPQAAVISNTKIGFSYKVADTNRFVAIKLMKEDKDYALIVTDEAAQAGFESRGSGSKTAAVESRTLTLSRKAHCDVLLISQLMSMIDKRGVWVANLIIYAEAGFLPDNSGVDPDFFTYTVYDSKLEYLDEFELWSIDALRHIWPHMDTDDVPLRESLNRQFKQYYEIEESDLKQFGEIMVAAKST